MSSPPPKTTIVHDDATKVIMFTKEGLPSDPRVRTAALATIDVGGGPARRIDCRPPQLLSAPSIRRGPKTPSPAVLQSNSTFVAGPNNSSLIDDDDDELVDYFSTSVGDNDKAQFANTATPATDNAMPLSSSRWNVLEHNVRSLPLFYPLEQSAVFVPQASASILSARIAAILQSRSIAASFDAVNAKVDCVSKSRVEFRIRLYRGRGEYNHGIIAEVQRRAGFDFNYAHDVNAILDAAEGKNTKECEGIIPTIYHPETEGEEGIDCIDSLEGFESLQMISDILCPKDNSEVMIEHHNFAMASLSSLTSFDRMGERAVQISNELFTSERCADLRQYVLSHVSQDTNQTPSQCLMIQSLEILANVAKNFSHSPSRLVDLLSVNKNEIIAKLIVNIENAPINPHAGDLSCVILQNMFASRAVVENSIPSEYRERLVTSLIGAVSNGGECHAELQRHSQYCLERIV
eukprot:CAMPEP_0196131772 /NCGR_PEP_ID=MMETSP0910-20130528/1638_1 /TAXON_ID=49265 /ORGANISM="Thalassiosira rotula, Strain GSO102" /LENGTH=462 /DNA_ID=CAMNT_0041391279 /DNA_START=1 /DNA_END=1389 /DNA_ORIENTATION=+